MEKPVITSIYGRSKTYKTNKTYIYNINNTSTRARTRKISLVEWQKIIKGYTDNRGVYMWLTILGTKLSHINALDENTVQNTKKIISNTGDDEIIELLQKYCNELENTKVYI